MTFRESGIYFLVRSITSLSNFNKRNDFTGCFKKLPFINPSSNCPDYSGPPGGLDAEKRRTMGPRVRDNNSHGFQLIGLLRLKVSFFSKTAPCLKSKGPVIFFPFYLFVVFFLNKILKLLIS